MNLGGQALLNIILTKKKVDVENTLTIVNVQTCPLTKIRLEGSGSQGHNGLKDIEVF